MKVTASHLCLCSIDDGFPVVKFHFEDSLTLTVYPHDYLFEVHVSCGLGLFIYLFLW